MQNNHVHKHVMEYCFSKVAPQYALLIKGAWGSGKTWVIKKIIKEIREKQGKELYVSLYGINSFAAIENEFYRSLHPVLSSKGMAVAGRILTGTLKAAIKLDLTGDGKDDATLNLAVPNINLPEYLKNTEGLVLIFDDVERCSIPIVDLLGYINHFVEVQEYKVILVANEDELAAKDERYYQIKEKLIGKSFEIVPETDLAIQNFIAVTKHELFFDFYIQEVTKVYKESGYNNLRHLRQAFLDFQRFEEKLPRSVTDCKELVKHIIQLFFAFTIEIRHGALTSDQLMSLKSDWMAYAFEFKKHKDIDNKPVSFKLREKYSILSSESLLLENNIWNNILFKSIIDVEEVTSQLLNSKYLVTWNSPRWIRLWYFRSHSDEEFVELFRQVWKDFVGLVYKDVYELKHVVGMSLFFSNIGLIKISVSRVLATAMVCVRKLRKMEMLDIKSARHHDDVSSLGMGYLSSETKEFKDFAEFIRNQGGIAFSERLPSLGLSLLDDLKASPSTFSYTLNYSNSYEFNYRELPILAYIPTSDFLHAILNLPADELNNAFEFLRERYRHGASERLAQEKDWLLELRDRIWQEVESRKGTLFGYCLQEVVDRSLNVALEKFSSIDEVKNPSNDASTLDSNSQN